MFSNSPRNFKLIADTECTLWKMDKKTYEDFAQRSPLLAVKFMRLVLSFDAMRAVTLACETEE